jgi:hypothetical protein
MSDTTIVLPVSDTTIALPAADTTITLTPLIIPPIEYFVPQRDIEPSLPPLAEILAPVVVPKLVANECVINEPPSTPLMNVVESNTCKGNGNSLVSFGFRAGINLSHAYAKYEFNNDNGSGDYGDILRMQLGFVIDIAASNRFHIQPGLMYIQKGMSDRHEITAHYIEFPLLLSLKFSALRLSAGPYIGLCLNSDSKIFDDGGFDIGLNMGLGFDVGMFYIGTFYEYGYVDMSNKNSYDFYNRTLGFNLGVNL